MKLIPSDHLKSHLLEQNVVMPEGGFDIPDGEYESTAAELAQSPMHRHESEEAFTDRVNYALVWKLYGQQQNGNQRGVDLVNAQRMEVMTRSLTKMQDSSLPDIAQKVSAAVEAGSNLVSWSVKEHKDSSEAKSAELVTAVSNLQTFNGENHAESLKVTGERHADLIEIFGKLLCLGKWILGILVAGFLFLAAIGILTGILGIHAHAQIDIIRFQDNAGLPVGTMAAPFAIKAGSNCSLARVNSVITFNCTGGAAAAGGLNGQVQWNNATALGGISTFTTDGTANTAKVGTNWSFADPTDATKKFQFDASNIATATTRIVNIPNANSTTVQPDTGAANNFLTAISAQGLISKARPACANLSDSGTLCTSSATIPTDISSKKYLIQTADAALPNAQAMGALGTGIVKNTTTTGVQSIAVAGDFPTLNQSTTGTAAAWTTARNLAGNSVDGTANVAFANKFIMQGTADTGLSGAQFMGALGTGIVKNTTTTGVQSIAVAGDFPTLNQNTSGSAASFTGSLVGDVTGTQGAAVVGKVNGIAYSGTAAAHSVEVVTTANTTATAKVIPDCTDVTGNHLNFTQSTDTWTCGTTDSHLGTVTSVSGTTNEIASTGGTTPVLSVASTFDIHGKTSTAPIKAGTTAAAPATCQANIELYIKTDATAGQQVFICNGTGNGWNLVGDGGGAGGGVNDPGANGVMVRTALNTTTARTLTGTANQIAVTNGDGVADAPTFAIANPLTIPGETTLAAPTTGAASLNFPSGVAPTTPSAGDVWLDTNEIHMVVQAATQGVVNLYNSAGTFVNGLTSAPTANRTTTFPDVTGTVGMIVASGTSTFTTTAAAASACQTTVTTAATGALTTDVISYAYASAPVAATDGRMTLHAYVTANNVNFMRCNNTAASVTPTALVVNWMVIRR